MSDAIDNFKQVLKNHVFPESDDLLKIKNEDDLMGITIDTAPSISVEKRQKKSFSVRSGSKQGGRIP
jgi:hypothetical protein